jgi:hypothetical protein
MKVRWGAVLGAAFAAMPACQSSGIGDPCVPEDEYQRYFSGYEVSEVNLETRSFQCESRICLVNHFQGRVSCPYGQSLADGAEPRCHIPGSTGADGAIRVDARPQLLNRRAADAVYCSCRCGGSDENGRYCKCPPGFSCTPLLLDIGIPPAELNGSYCVKAGTEYDARTFFPAEPCDRSKHDCGNEDGS